MSEQKRFVDRLDARPGRLALRPAANRHAMAALSGSPGRGRDASRPMSRVATRAQRPPRTARRLMAVAQHPVIAKGTHASLLPPSWTTLYELTRLPEETLEAKIAEGVIHAGIERKDAEGFLEPHRDEPAAPCLRWLKFTASRPRKQATRAAQIRLHAPFLGGKMQKIYFRCRMPFGFSSIWATPSSTRRWRPSAVFSGWSRRSRDTAGAVPSTRCYPRSR